MTEIHEIYQLGERFSEVKRLYSGKFCAYDTDSNKAFGVTAKEALENLLNKNYGYKEKAD